ncbi:amidohydrolase [Virgibacillus halodenitrificans]
MIMHNLLQKGMRFEDYTAEELDKELIDKSNENVRLDSAKLFQDGSIQAFTAALREPYYSGSKEKGKIFQKQDAFNKEVLNLHERGFRIAVHGNGDRAIESILDAYAHAIKEAPRKEHKHRIEHVQTAMTKDIKRMEELGVAGSFFINHVYYWGERHAKIFLGPDRASRMNPLAEAVEHNLLFTLHSDCPVTPISPLFSIWAAVNRCTTEGNILGPEQRIDVITALKSMTLYGARLNFDEDNSGSIEVGKRADFVLLDKDPTVIDPIKIKDISVEETWIGGNQVYKQEID